MFGSDTAAPAHPAMIQALLDANAGVAPSYGADDWSGAVQRRLSEVFETEVACLLVASGTASNALALSVLCPPTGAIACHAEAHIERDERGAPEFFTGGGKLRLLPGAHARIDPEGLRAAIAANKPDFVHETPLSVLSLSNLSECGAACWPDDVRLLAGLAHGVGMAVHMDGARFANALATVGCAPADLTWRAGVDVLSLGATKNGALGCEAIVLFGDARERFAELQARAKRSGHLPPKQRFLAAQMLAWLENDLWLDLAGRANASAQALGAIFSGAGYPPVHPVDGNEVFVRLPPDLRRKLTEHKVLHYEWLDGSCRFVCSWATTTSDIRTISELV